MRIQLALNVVDLPAAIDFYAAMFDTPPAKVKPGYANFAIANPPLKLVLFESEAGSVVDGSINHLGVEVESVDEVVAAETRLGQAGLETTGVAESVCCFAEKTETWLGAPDGNRWEWYVKRADVDTQSSPISFVASPVKVTSAPCCSPGGACS